ncbi:hypothetical protein ACFFLZ_11990 [Photobacterium aphoticum]|uniref:hypothetical protein n=1 Tax=Photobacterium aphoticum TaxID=754436 RepID=UPI0011B1C70D|nr:hypothetical protein [Photobacterium aphoticum]
MLRIPFHSATSYWIDYFLSSISRSITKIVANKLRKIITNSRRIADILITPTFIKHAAKAGRRRSGRSQAAIKNKKGR